jgi:acylaminoacyl-peptidase
MISPPRVYLYRIESETISPLTPKDYEINLTQLASPQSIWYNSFDGRKIHGWYVPAASEAPSNPAVIYVHGDP